MSTSVRQLPDLEAAAAVASLQILRLDILKLRQGVIWHADASSAISTADAVTGDGYVTAVALANVCRSAYAAHRVSVCDATTGIGCHISADSTNVLTAPVATDLASANTLVNDIKAKFNLHRASAVFHPVADSTNNVSAADATDEASLVTLVNQIKAKLNLHFAGALSSSAILLVAP